MNQFKKIVSVLICAMMIFSLAACGTDSDSKDKNDTTASTEDNSSKVAGVDINIACMKGPTAIGMAKLLTDSDSKTTLNNYIYTIAGTADVINTALLKGTLDVAAVPCNVASVLYNKSKGEIVVAAINTLGVLYIVETGNEVQSIEDLRGKTIYSTGQGTTPEYTLRYILQENGIDPDKDVTIEYKSEATEITALISAGQDVIAMLPQPYVTVASNASKDLRIALDVTKEWEKVSDDSTVVTGVIVVRKEFAEKNKAAFNEFLKEYSASTTYANENVDETAALIGKLDIFKEAIAKKAIPYCNVTCIVGDEMQSKIDGYLKVLFDSNPAAVGGKLPDSAFYYSAE